jgi:Glycosyl transferase family 90
VIVDRVTLDLLSVQAETGPKWLNKTSVAFWRGRDSRQERLDLVKMSHKYPDIIDARLTRMFFFKHTEDLGKMAEHISFFDFFKVLLRNL